MNQDNYTTPITMNAYDALQEISKKHSRCPDNNREVASSAIFVYKDIRAWIRDAYQKQGNKFSSHKPQKVIDLLIKNLPGLPPLLFDDNARLAIKRACQIASDRESLRIENSDLLKK